MSNDYNDEFDATNEFVAEETTDENTDIDAETTDDAAQPDTDGDGAEAVDAFGQLESFKERMDASVKRLEEARQAMHDADAEYETRREHRNEIVSAAEKEANEKIAEVRNREMEAVAEVRREADVELDSADEAADEATIAYKQVFDDVVKSGVLTRDMLSALGYNKVTKRRVAARKK